MDWGKVLAIAVSILALSGVVVLQTNGIRADIASMRTEAAADRRAMQDSMDTFRAEMLRLAERQARTEGQVAALSRHDKRETP